MSLLDNGSVLKLFFIEMSVYSDKNKGNTARTDWKKKNCTNKANPDSTIKRGVYIQMYNGSHAATIC